MSMDNYQAIYDAVRSRIGSFDGHRLIEEIRQQFDISFQAQQVKDAWCAASYDQSRPSVLYRPTIGVDGSKWCALYGEDLMNGVCGFGDTPAEAMEAFDKAWLTERTPTAMRIEAEAK